MPFAFLIGLLRGRMAHADAVSELLVKLGEASSTDGLRCLLADALDDPRCSSSTGSTAPGSRARTGAPPSCRADRARWTPVELDGQRIGAIVHDRACAPSPRC